MLALMGVYRDGWRRPLEGVELWEGLSLVATLSGTIMAQLVAHHVEGAALERTIRAELRLPPRPVLQALNGRRLRGRAPEEQES